MTGVLNGTAVFAPRVTFPARLGMLVNISSGAGTKPYAGCAAFSASKAAVDQFTRVVAMEEADHGLRAYSLAPRLVDTDMQTAIRSTDETSFPEVERFRRATADAG